MEHTFEELSPEELKMTALQFIGQNLSGPLKELESCIVTKNPTLQGKTIDPLKIVNSIPAPQRPSPIATTVNAGININTPRATLQPEQITTYITPVDNNIDNNQLEFDFERKAKYSDILDALDSIKIKLDRIESKLNSD